MSTVFSLYRASLKEFVRDRMTIFWTLAFPILFIIIFGLIFGGGNTNKYDVGLAVEDQGQAGQALAQAFNALGKDNGDQKAILNVTQGSRDDQLNALKAGKRDFVIVIPDGTSQAVAAKQPAKVEFYNDPSRGTANNQIEQGIVQGIVGAFNKQLQGAPPVAIATNSVASHTLGAIDFLIPGILAMSLMQLGLFGTAQPVVELRTSQVLRRLGATPLPRWKLLASQVLLRLTIAIGQTVLLIGIGAAVFNVHVQGNWLALAGMVLLGAAAFISIGYLIAAVSPTAESAAGISSALNFPMLFFSGIFFPLAALPVFLTPLVKALPLTYVADGIRQVMIGGTPEFPLLVDVGITVAWILVCGLLASRLFKWE